MVAFTATLFRGHGLSSVAVTTTFGATHRLPSIVESRYARNYIPKFQAKVGAAEEEADGPWVGLPQPPLTTPLPSKYPTPVAFPMGGVAGMRKAPENEGASVIGSSHSLTGVRSTTVFKCVAVPSVK